MLHEADDVDAEAEEVLNELHLLAQSEGGTGQQDPQEWSKLDIYTFIKIKNGN